jgi:PPK2 family polyphosphate:nucleotide phosphotransferase
VKHEALRVPPGHRLRLSDHDPAATDGFERKRDAAGKLKHDIVRLAELQDVFAAARSHALLIVLQGMDSAGKDGAVKHVMSGVNAQGIDVHSFKEPSAEENAHDFLWRCERVLPERGRIAIFNRSYYEDVVVVRVHRELLESEGAAPQKHLWRERFEDINAFERHLTRNGTVILKFFLHLSKDEQKKRLLKRLDDPEKNWKFSAGDVVERRSWDRYQFAYEQALEATSTGDAPWYVIPADHKWFMRTAIADIVVARLEALDLHYPRIEGAAADILAQARAELEGG